MYCWVFFMPETSKNHFISLGQVGKPRGLRGDFFVSGREDVWPASIRKVWLGEAGVDKYLFKVKSILKFNQKIAAKLEGLNSREDLEPFAHKQIWCDRSDIHVNYQEEYLWSDLIGLEVVDIDNLSVGTVQGFENYGAHDNIVIGSSTQLLELPFVDQYFNRDWQSKPERIQMTCKSVDVAELWSDKK